MQEFKNITHTFEPVFDENSKILILGTFPSVKSRENHFYYGHPQNRFWKVMAAVMDSTQPQTIDFAVRRILPIAEETAEEFSFGKSYCGLGCDSQLQH